MKEITRKMVIDYLKEKYKDKVVRLSTAEKEIKEHHLDQDEIKEIFFNHTKDEKRLE